MIEMKKIMFNDRYGLTEAVLQGRKTMTRRIVPQSIIDYYLYEAVDPTIIDAAKYEIGEVVAIAQRYCDVSAQKLLLEDGTHPADSIGWSNKMFVKAHLMPHHIKITDIKVERLQDISDEDCLREGIEEHLKGVQYGHPATQYCGQFPFSTPRAAFAALIDKVSGKGTWESNPWVFAYEFELIN